MRKRKKERENSFTKLCISQPGFQLHSALLETIVNHLDSKDLSKRTSLKIIEIGSGYGLLARILLSQLNLLFPTIKIEYFGMEIESDRVETTKNNLEIFDNIEVHCEDFFQNDNNFKSNSDITIVCSTGLIQCLHYTKILRLLSLHRTKENLYGVVTYPFIQEARGDTRISPGNDGAAEFSFNITRGDINTIARELKFQNTTEQIVMVDNSLNVIHAYEYNGIGQ